MTEPGAIRVDRPPLKEVPRVTTEITLPEITRIGENSVRLGMHTDTVQTLLRTLYIEPLARQIRIEGRVLTPDQAEALDKDPTYRFYMGSRGNRQSLLVPQILGLSSDEVADLVQTPFGPDSLSSKLGYQTGYFDASMFIDKFLEGRPNDLLGIIGGINRFRIGSDTLTPEQLRGLADKLRDAFMAQEFQTAGIVFRSTPGFIQMPYAQIFNKNNVYKILQPIPNINNKNNINTLLPKKDNLNNKF